MRSHSPQTIKMQKDKSKLQNHSPPNPPRIPSTPLFLSSKNQSTSTSRLTTTKKKTETYVSESKKLKNPSKITDLAQSLFDLSLGLCALSDVLSEIDNLKNNQALSTYKHSSILTLLNTSTKCPNDVQLSILSVAKKMLKLGIAASRKVLTVYYKCSLLLIKSQCFFISYGEDQETPQRKLTKLVSLFKEQLNSCVETEKDLEVYSQETELDCSKSVSASSVKTKASRSSRSSKSPSQSGKSSQLSKPVITAQKTANLRISQRQRSPKGNQSEPVSPLSSSKYPKKPNSPFSKAKNDDAKSRVSTKSSPMRKRSQSKRLSPRRDRKDSLKSSSITETAKKVRHYSTQSERYPVSINEIESSELIGSNEVILDLNSADIINTNEIMVDMTSAEIETEPIMRIKKNINEVLIDEEDEISTEINSSDIPKKFLLNNFRKSIFNEDQDKLDQLGELTSSKESLGVIDFPPKSEEIQNEIANEDKPNNEINEKTEIKTDLKQEEEIDQGPKTIIDQKEEITQKEETPKNIIDLKDEIDQKEEIGKNDIDLKEETQQTDEIQTSDEITEQNIDNNFNPKDEIKENEIDITDDIKQKESTENIEMQNELDKEIVNPIEENEAQNQKEETKNGNQALNENIVLYNADKENVQTDELEEITDQLQLQPEQIEVNTESSNQEEFNNSIKQNETKHGEEEIDHQIPEIEEVKSNEIDQKEIKEEIESHSIDQQDKENELIPNENDQIESIKRNEIASEIQIDSIIQSGLIKTDKIDQSSNSPNQIEVISQEEQIVSNEITDVKIEKIDQTTSQPDRIHQNSNEQKNSETVQQTTEEINEMNQNKLPNNIEMNHNSTEQIKPNSIAETNQNSVKIIQEINTDSNDQSLVFDQQNASDFEEQIKLDKNEDSMNLINDNDFISQIDIEPEREDLISYQYSANSMDYDFNSPIIEIVPFTYKKERSSKQRYILDDDIKRETPSYSIPNRSRIPIPERKPVLTEAITHNSSTSTMSSNFLNINKNHVNVNKSENEKQVRFGKPVSNSVLKFIKSQDCYSKRAEHGLNIYKSLDNHDQIIIMKYVSQLVSWNSVYVAAKNIWSEMKSNDNFDTDALFSQTPAEFGAFLVDALRIFADVEGYF